MTETLAIVLFSFVALAVVGAIAIILSRKSRKSKVATIMSATHEELQEAVKASIKEIDLAIALSCLCRKFNEDDRIEETFNNTYEAHPYNMCRSSIEYCLALALVRCHDRRRDSHGLSSFFEMIKDDETYNNLREGILHRRRQNVDEQQALAETQDHLDEIEAARKLHVTLMGSHQYARVKNFRHTQVAHRGRDTENVRHPQIGWLYELTQSSQAVVDLLCKSVLGSHEDFQRGIEIWEEYTRLFFDSMMERAAN